MESALQRAVGKGDTERMRTLLDAGANPDSWHQNPGSLAVDKMMTPLMLAASLMQPAAVSILVAYGANVNLRSQGRTALIEAV
jgi:ankyrin repeat protein